MTTGSTRSFVLELEAEAQPLTGRVREDPGASVDFVGWLGLASALERLIEGHEPGATAEAGESAGQTPAAPSS